MWFSLYRRAHSFEVFARASQIEGGLFSTCSSRLSAVQNRFKDMQEPHGLRVAPFQNVVLVSAPHTFAFKSSEKCHGLRAVPFSKKVALALAPRTFAFNIYPGFTDSHYQRTRNGVWKESGL
eukprot:4711800-Pyramimonas_sp.AAC.1